MVLLCLAIIRARHKQQLRSRARVASLIAATAMSLFWAAVGQVAAENTVTLTITPAGPLSATVQDGDLFPVVYSTTAQRDTGSLRVAVRDRRGTSEGWTVSLSASDFVYLGSSALGRNIPSTAFRIVNVGVPVVVAGQPRGEHGPHAMSIVGSSLASPRTVMWTAPGGGSGDYEQSIEVELDIPAGSQPGRYIATMTVAFTSAP